MASNDPLHGKTLERILQDLAATIGWKKMAQTIPIRCFMFDPSVKSSLVFLRRTPWARKQVEELYVQSLALINRNSPSEPLAPDRPAAVATPRTS
jgi:uncharacterized protein (DUF2132 family)